MIRLPGPLRRPSHRTQTALLTVLLTFALGTQGAMPDIANARGAPGASPGARVGGPQAKPAIGATEPGIQYEEAMAHAADQRAFTPGGLVTVPFHPRRSDTWAVDGAAPRALPAGRASGSQMAASHTGSTWADVPGAAIPGAAAPSAPVDAPAGSAAPADTTVALLPQPASPATDAVSASLRRQVLGFLPYWNLGSPSTVLDYDLLSTVAYFGVGADSSGNLTKSGTGWSGWTSAALTTVINAAHARGTRVVLTVEMFAWNTSQAQAQAAFLGSASAQLNLARQAAAAVRDRGADGVNLDFEPIASGYGSQFVAFVKTVRSQLSAISPGYQLTVDTTGWPGNYALEGIVGAGGADAVFIMGYDYRSDTSNPVGSIDPLYSPRIYDLTDTLNAYLARIPASKILLGLPWYGRAWSTSSSQPNAANQSGATYGYSASPSYAIAAELAAANGRRYDTVEQSAWTAYTGVYGTCGCTTWRELYYDDAQSLGARYDLINRMGLRGTGIWALGNDGYMDGSTVHRHPDLWQPIADHFLSDLTPPLAGIVDLPDTQRDEGFTVSWTGWDDWTGIRSYDVQVSVDGGTWSAWLSGTTASRDVYLGQTGHGYAFRVRARDGAGNVSSWNVTTSSSTTPALASGGFARVVTSQVNLRSSTSIVDGSNIVTTVNQGTTLAITAGPVVDSGNGLTWYQVTAPITEWGTVNPVKSALWVAAGDASGPYIAAVPAPNTTWDTAGLSGLSFSGLGPASLGPSGANARLFTPGAGSRPALEIDWTDRLAMGSLALQVFSTGGSLLGSVPIGARGAGPQRFDWDGTANGVALGSGPYVLQLVGIANGSTYEAPASSPVTPAQIAMFAVTIDRAQGATYVPLTRPGRLFDTRQSSPLASGVPRTFQMSGFVGVPSGALAITGNLTVTGETYRGYVALTPQATATPAISTINFPTGDTRANGVTVPLAPDGSLAAVYVTGRAGDRANLILDVTGYFR